MDGLQASVEKMRREGIAEPAIRTFEHYYEQLRGGETGMLPESEIEPVEDVQDLDDLPEGDPPLDQVIVLKLNGGLGTSMGMTRAKSLIEAKDGMTFLDIIARQVIELRERTGARLPLVLMNSFYTRDDSLEALRAHRELESDVPPDFVQNKEPKIRVDDLMPVEWPPDPSLEWCPPGHRDVNTNNLWVDLEALQRVMAERDGVLGLPLIVNRKTVDPGDPSTPEVYQLETAMGAAIGVFDGAQPVRVSRRRFSPVKTTEDLLALRSDAYVLAEDARVELAPQRDGRPPVVDLDSEYYKLLRAFEARFPAGAPSLV